MTIGYREGLDLPLDQLGALYRAVGWEWYVQYLEAMLRGSTWAVSAWNGSVLVGCARVVSDDVLDSLLLGVCVHPTYQRQGIGSALLAHVTERFAHTNILLTRRRALDAFYARHGFAPMDRAMRRPGNRP